MGNWQSLPFEECIEPVVYTAKVQRKYFLSDGAYPIVSQEDAFINGFWNEEADIFRVDHPLIVFGDHTRALKYIDFDFVLGADGVKVLKPKPFLHPRFFYYQLHTAKLASLGYARHYRLLKEHQVAFPAYSEQQRVVAILDEAFDGIATANANAEKNLQNARELFTSRLECVFSEQALSWRRVSLESIGATQTGSTPKSSEPENLGNYLPFVKPGDFNRDGSIRFDNEGLSEIGAHKARRVQANSALMVCIGATIGKSGFSEREIATNQQVNAWTPTTNTSPKFIYYQMTSSNFQLRVRQGAGQATLPIINKSKWSALTVVIPPTLDEQIKIVADLDELLAESLNLEAVYERKLAALDELKKSLLHQAFMGALTDTSTDRKVAEVA